MLTIGLPVYNGARYISQTIKSIISQSFTDFNLLITDNASTDMTKAICEEYVRMDSRIRYHRHKINMGVSKNWNYIARQANSKYFKWASANDLIHDTMLEKCVAILEEREDVVLCYPKTTLINEEGMELTKFEDNLDIMHDDPVIRFIELFKRLKLNNAQNGIIRTSVLKKTKLEGLFIGGDIPFMAELILHGKFYEYPEYLFSRRLSADASTLSQDIETLSKIYSPSKTLGSYQRSRFYLDLLHRVQRTKIILKSKLSLYKHIIKLIYWERLNNFA